VAQYYAQIQRHDTRIWQRTLAAILHTLHGKRLVRQADMQQRGLVPSIYLVRLRALFPVVSHSALT
jgi:hypothetical protein